VRGSHRTGRSASPGLESRAEYASLDPGAQIHVHAMQEPHGRRGLSWGYLLDRNDIGILHFSDHTTGHLTIARTHEARHFFMAGSPFAAIGTGSEIAPGMKGAATG